MTKKWELPSLLAFSRKLEVSGAVMMSGIWKDENIDQSEWKPIELHEKRNRGTKSHYGVSDKEKMEPNLSHVDDAALPYTADTLRVSFSLKAVGQLDQPVVCNNAEFEKRLGEKIKEYRETYQFKDLAMRYAKNIANGRFLWRNRVGAEMIKIQVKHDGRTWWFNAYDYPLDKFTPSEDSNLAELSQVVRDGLAGSSFKYIEINAFAKIGFGQHVWPSQEMVLQKKESEKSRFLFQLDNCAAMHPEKIGNALRTIDTWYSGGDDASPIAVEPYGAAPSRGQVSRESENDFYTLFLNWLNGGQIAQEQQHYIIATLIRGGVFSGEKEEKKKQKEKENKENGE